MTSDLAAWSGCILPAYCPLCPHIIDAGDPTELVECPDGSVVLGHWRCWVDWQDRRAILATTAGYEWVAADGFPPSLAPIAGPRRRGAWDGLREEVWAR